MATIFDWRIDLHLKPVQLSINFLGKQMYKIGLLVLSFCPDHHHSEILLTCCCKNRHTFEMWPQNMLPVEFTKYPSAHTCPLE